VVIGGGMAKNLRMPGRRHRQGAGGKESAGTALRIVEKAKAANCAIYPVDACGRFTSPPNCARPCYASMPSPPKE